MSRKSVEAFPGTFLLFLKDNKADNANNSKANYDEKNNEEQLPAWHTASNIGAFIIIHTVWNTDNWLLALEKRSNKGKDNLGEMLWEHSLPRNMEIMSAVEHYAAYKPIKSLFHFCVLFTSISKNGSHTTCNWANHFNEIKKTMILRNAMR